MGEYHSVICVYAYLREAGVKFKVNEVSREGFLVQPFVVFVHNFVFTGNFIVLCQVSLVAVWALV